MATEISSSRSIEQTDLIQTYSSIQRLASAIRFGSTTLADFGKEIEALSKEWHNQSPAQSYYLDRSDYIAVNLVQQKIS